MTAAPHPARAGGVAAGAVALATAGALLLAGCGSGRDAETRVEKFGNGVNADAGALRIRNLQLQAPAGTDVVRNSGSLVFSVYNEGQAPARLTRVTVAGGASVQVTASAGTSASASASPSAAASFTGFPLPIPAGGSLALQPGGNAQLQVTGIGTALHVGESVDVSLDFAVGGGTVSTGTLATPVEYGGGTTATSTPMTVSPQHYPSEVIDPTYFQQPFDQRSGVSAQP